VQGVNLLATAVAKAGVEFAFALHCRAIRWKLLQNARMESARCISRVGKRRSVFGWNHAVGGTTEVAIDWRLPRL
jgi:hypothetical protein